MRRGMVAILALVAGVQAAGAQGGSGGEDAIADRLREIDERLGEIDRSLGAIDESNSTALWVSLGIAALAAGAAAYYAYQLRKQLKLLEADVRYRLRPVLMWGTIEEGVSIGVYCEDGGQGGLWFRLVNTGQVSAEEIVAYLDVRLVGSGTAPHLQMQRLGALGPGESVKVRFPMPAADLGRALGGGMAYIEALFAYRGGGSEGLTYRVAGYRSGVASILFGKAGVAMPPSDAARLDHNGAEREAQGGDAADENGARRALEESDRALEADPGDVTARTNRAAALRRLGRHTEALDDARRARADDPTHVGALRETALALEALGRYGEAIDYLRLVVESGAGDLLVERDLVRLHTFLDQHEPAHAALSRIAAQEPSYEAHMELADRCMVLRWYGPATVEFGKAMDMEPGRPGAHIGQGTAQANAGRHREAAAAFRRAIALAPGSAAAHAGLAQELHALGQAAGALEAFRMAVEADPGSQQTHVSRGVMMLEMGLWEGAQASFAEARRLDPSMRVPQDERDSAGEGKG